jgi:hypothetical protein
LVRALVRFHYDEWIYNTHWGGDGAPESLLYRENPIVEHASAPGFPREAGDIEGFFSSLFDPPYPGYDKGIALFAGHDQEVGRLPKRDAIGTSSSSLYKNS